MKPETVASEIYERLNEKLKYGSKLNDFEVMELTNKARKLKAPLSNACLAAICAHAEKFSDAIENAQACVKHSIKDFIEINNALAALMNARLYDAVVNIASKYEYILEDPKCASDVYKSAVYTVNLDFCEYLYSKHESNEYSSHKSLLNYVEKNNSIKAELTEYLTFAFKSLVMECHNSKSEITSVTSFDLLNGDNQELLSVEVAMGNLSIDEIIDLELEWHKNISTFQLTNPKLVNVAFGLGAL